MSSFTIAANVIGHQIVMIIGFVMLGLGTVHEAATKSISEAAAFVIIGGAAILFAIGNLVALMALRHARRSIAPTDSED